MSNKYQWMPLKDVLRSLPAMDKKGVSKVARGKQASTQTREGFVEAYIATNGSINGMSKRLTGRNDHETWSDRRNQFISRHLKQMRDADTYSDGWLPNGEPTPRHLGLIAWAYTPSPKKLQKWLESQPKEWKQYVSNPKTIEYRRTKKIATLAKKIIDVTTNYIDWEDYEKRQEINNNQFIGDLIEETLKEHKEYEKLLKSFIEKKEILTEEIITYHDRPTKDISLYVGDADRECDLDFSSIVNAIKEYILEEEDFPRDIYIVNRTILDFYTKISEYENEIRYGGYEEFGFDDMPSFLKNKIPKESLEMLIDIGFNSYKEDYIDEWKKKYANYPSIEQDRIIIENLLDRFVYISSVIEPISSKMNPAEQLSFSFEKYEEEDPVLPQYSKKMMDEIVSAISDFEAGKKTILVGNKQSPKNPNVVEAIRMGFLSVVDFKPHMSGMYLWVLKPTQKAINLIEKRRSIQSQKHEQISLFNNPHTDWMNRNATFITADNLSLYNPPHEITDYDKLRSIKKSMLKKGWIGYPLLSIGFNLLTGTHRHGAIKEIIEEYRDSDSDIFIEKVESLGLSGHDESIPIIDVSEYLSDDDFDKIEDIIDEEDKIEYLSTIKNFPKEIIAIYQQELSNFQNNPQKYIVVPIHLISKIGVHEKIGEIKLSDSPSGLRIDTDLYNLPIGYHGTHIHEYGSLLPSKKGSKTIAGGSAGSHYDPENAGYHGSPNGNGHRGDLPKIHVDEYGESKQTLYAPRLTLDEVMNRSIIIHRYGDNYSDTPLQNGGGKERMAGGIISDSCPHCKKNPIVRDSEGRKIPEKYLKGYTGKQREDRIKEIGRRRTEYAKAYEKYGDEQNFPQAVLDKIYRPFSTDNGETNKESSYTKEAHKRGFVGDLEKKAISSSAYYGGVIPVSILKEVYRRGIGAWPTGHRKRATKEQWAYARVNSFLVGGKTFFTADQDLAKMLPENVYNNIIKKEIK